MTWRDPALSCASLAVAALAWWLTPDALALAGLGDLDIVGRVCLTVAALSVLDVVLQRLERRQAGPPA